MNLGMTLSVGVYSVVNALISEMVKGPHTWDGKLLAAEFAGESDSCNYYGRNV